MRAKLTSARRCLVIVFVFTIAAIWLFTIFTALATADDKSAAKPEPVVESMHQFMEYVFEPNYKLLHTAMTEAPKDKAGWKPVKAASMMLAEGGNLLLMRLPDENADSWKKLSVAVRQHGGDLYAAARASDYDVAYQHYVVMLNNCNECHKQFADGKYQLEP